MIIKKPFKFWVYIIVNIAISTWVSQVTIGTRQNDQKSLARFQSE